MKTILENLRNPRFDSKLYYIMILPALLLPYELKLKLQDLSRKYYKKAPKFMHRLRWTMEMSK